VKFVPKRFAPKWAMPKRATTNGPCQNGCAIKSCTSLGVCQQNGCEWDSNPCPRQPETNSGIEVAAILQCKMALDNSAKATLCWFKRISI